MDSIAKDAENKIQDIKNTVQNGVLNANKQILELKNKAANYQIKIQDIEATIKNLTDPSSDLMKDLLASRDNLFAQWTGTMNDIKGLEQQFTNITSQENLAKIYSLAEQLVSQSLENNMQEALDKLKINNKIPPDLMETARAIIRGHRTVELIKPDVINTALENINTKLTSYVDAQAKNLLEKNFLNETLSKEVLSSKIISSISDGLNQYKDLDSFFNKIDNEFKSMTNNHVIIDSQKILGPVLKNIKIDTDAVTKKLKPAIQQHVKKIVETAKYITDVQEQIKIAEKSFKETIVNYQNMAQDFINKKTAELGQKISQELGIKLTGFSLKI